MWEFVSTYEQELLRWFHVVLMAYWLGGEWGVFNASTNVARPGLGYDERMRALTLAFRIDILPRSAIVWLLPVGFQMGANLGVSPITGPWLWAVWGGTGFVWLLILIAFFARGTPAAMAATRVDESIRVVVIPALILSGAWSLAAGEPFLAQWFAVKLIIFGVLLSIGLGLRFIMRDWVAGFEHLKTEGSTPEVERIFTSTLARGRLMSYVYWILIATMAFLGIAKPF